MDLLPVIQAIWAVLVLVLMAFSTVLWFLFMSVRADARKANDGLAEHRVYCAENYVTSKELTESIGALNQTIDRLIAAVNTNMEETRRALSEIHRRVDTVAAGK
ncbi:hypothetical protein [Pararobbsia silviterrae]|nr:hypothetical protein [Pararobbsia silviterrae]